MGGTSIDDQENRACGTGDEALEKFNEDSGIDTALLLDHEPHLASRGDRRDEAHTMARAGGFDDRRFALLAPTTPGVMIRAHVGSIAKENLRFFPLRKRFDLRVFLLEPLLDQGLVALLRAVQRLLASDAELRQQSTNRIGAQRDAQLIQDQLGDHVARPQRERKLQLQRVLLSHGLIDPLHSSCIQFGRSSKQRLGLPRSPSTRRYCASHPYIVRRLILKDRATTSGFSPACTLRTARIRIASSVAWSSLRASSCFMPQGIMPDSARQEGSATTYGPINIASWPAGI